MDYDRLASKHRDAVYRQMVRVCGDHDDAEDVLAEALLAAYRSQERIRDDGAFRAWLATTARRVCYRLRQRESLRPLFVDLLDREVVSPQKTPQAELETKEVKRCVEAALAGLPDEFKNVYLLRDVQGLTGQETAKRLGISLPAMKTRLHRAREKVRHLLDKSLCAP